MTTFGVLMRKKIDDPKVEQSCQYLTCPDLRSSDSVVSFQSRPCCSLLVW
jgi:hypothetical protein